MAAVRFGDHVGDAAHPIGPPWSVLGAALEISPGEGRHGAPRSEEPKKGLYFGGDRHEPPKTVHQWKVFCLDLATGEVCWERQVH